MTHNVGGGRVTAASLDQLMKTERIDVAALQECPFYDYSPAQLGWHFYYGGDVCLVSRYPFRVLDVTDPANAWRSGARVFRFEIEMPSGRFQLLNVHLATIRGGIDALISEGRHGFSRLASNREQSTAESRDARGRIDGQSEPLIVAGDFNLPVESAIYRAYWGDFRNAFSACGRGFGHTKFTRLHGIRIDHVLTSTQWDCTDARVLSPPYDGDHAALVVDLKIRERDTHEW